MVKKKQRVVVELYDEKILDENLRKCIEREYIDKYKKIYGKVK